ncbi:RHS repeat-associated core domain-containing protein, partial [Cognatilysobacter lacus]
LHYLLGWDEVGNLTSLGDTASNPNISVPLRGYGYDGLNRLTAANDPNNTLLQGYAYDATGNRLSDTKVTSATGTTAYTYPATSHRLTQVGTVARTYDAMGDMLTGTVNGVAKTYTYDVTGRMNVAKNGSTVAMNYAYNGKGEQVRRYPAATSTAQTYEVYDEAGHWIGEYDVNGARKQEFIWLGDLPVGVYALSPGSTTAYQVYQVEPDHLGTPRAVVDATRQKAVWSWPLQNEAFGKSNPIQDPDADGKAFVLDMRFPGQRFDSGSGLNYNYFRDFDASAGRYAQSDPIGLRGGVSTFSLVKGSPLVYTDPFGLFVRVTYWISAGVISAYDTADPMNEYSTYAKTGGTFSTDGVFNSNGQAIPVGTYDILGTRRPGWYRLDPKDGTRFDDVDNATGRGAFRLHPGTHSLGCITVDKNSDSMRLYESIQTLIDNTRTVTITDAARRSLISGPYPIRYGSPAGTPVTYYGQLVVMP